MPGSGLVYHSTVTAYRQIVDPKWHHKYLEEPCDYERFLGPPTDKWAPRMYNLVAYASHILRVVLKRLNRTPVAQADRDVFADLFGPWEPRTWDIMLKMVRRLEPFANNPESIDMTLALGDGHLFKMDANYDYAYCEEEPEDEADADVQDVCSDDSEQLQGEEPFYFIDTTVPGVADAHELDEVPELALYPGDHFGTYTAPGSKDPSVCAQVVSNVVGPGWGDRSTQAYGIIYMSPRVIIHEGEAFLRSPASYDLQYGDRRPVVDLEKEPTTERHFLRGPPALLIHELFHLGTFPGVDGSGRPMGDQSVSVDGQVVQLYTDSCYNVPKTPENIEVCLKNPDSYSFFIMEIFLLEQGWRWSRACERWTRYPGR